MILYASSPEDYLREIRRHPHLREDRDSTHRAEILFEFVRRGDHETLAFIAPRIVELELEYEWLELKGFGGILDIITNEDFERILHWLESTDSAFRFIVMNTWARVGGPLHRDSECLLQLAWEDDGSRDSRGACRLLGTRPSQPVIELGEYYLKQGSLDLATLLLMRAWRPEYTSVFQKQTRWTIPKTADELDAYHDLACQSVELMKEAKHLSLVPLAEWVIQFNPCCVCREHSIQFLSEHGLLSPELASESRFDAVKFE